DFCWCPEGLREADAALLGPLPGLRGRRVLEVGAGAAQCSRWLAARGVDAVATDVAPGMVEAAAALDARTGITVPARVADARDLRPGGRWVCSATHPLRGAFPDDPTAAGLTVVRSYFDRTPYVEEDAAGEPVYAEFHRTFGDHVRDVVGAGLVLLDVVEPEWPDDLEEVWGGWGPERGRLLPGTAIFRTRKPPA